MGVSGGQASYMSKRGGVDGEGMQVHGGCVMKVAMAGVAVGTKGWHAK